MKTHPAALEEKLGFDVLRAWLRERVLSPLGADRLASMRTADDLGWLQGELARVAEWAEAQRFDEVVPLNHVLDVREALRRAAPQDAYLDPEDLHALRLVLLTLRRVRRYFEKRADDYPRLAERVRRVTPLQALEDHVAGILGENAQIRDDASAELARIRQAITDRERELRRTLQGALREATRQGYATEEQPTIRGGRMVLPIRAEAKRKVEGFVHDTSATGQTVYIEPAACLDLNNAIRELQAAERREIERILRVATGRVREVLDPLRANVRALAEMDLLQAKARLTNEVDAVVPAVRDEGEIVLKEARNPVLQLHFGRPAARDEDPREVVPLDLSLGAEARTLVITGPNAGGKTVAMKTVGLLALMLAYGLPLPAAPGTRFDLFEQLIVDIGDEQSIEEDLSTFSSHIANLRHMVREAHPRTLVLIDEAGTGTDPEEGGALAQAVLERLTERGARTIATTHHGTLKAYAHETDGVVNGSMEFDQETLRPTYHFREGIPGSSYAFEIADRMGLAEGVLERSRTIAGKEKTRLADLIATFEQRTQALQQQLDEARQAEREAAHQRDTYERRAAKQKKEAGRIRQQALEEAERIVQGANARIERTIREIKEAEAEREATRTAREAFEEYRGTLKDESVEAERREPEDAEARKVAAGGGEDAQPAAGDGAASPDRQPGAPIAEGDRVVLDDGATPMDVEEVEGDEAVVTAGAMRLRVDLDRLTRVGGRRSQQVTVGRVQDSSGSADLPALSARDRIDLRGWRVQEARKAVERLLDEAVAAGAHRVEILHGKGTGALRETIQEYLGTRPDVASYEEAPWDQGGAGVTLVTLA